MALTATSGIFAAKPKHVALRGVGIPTQQKVGRREMEERQGVGRHVLPQLDQLPQLDGRGSDRDAHDDLAGLRGSDGVRMGADAADTRRDVGHLGEVPAFAELLEAAELVHMEPRAFHLVLRVEVES
jgi:hypothetical protein